MKTDRELLDTFLQTRDNKAFEEFFAHHYSYFYKRSLFYIKNEEDRKDFLQDFWMDIFIHAGQLKTDEEGSAAAYLNITYTHDIYDFYKKRQWATVSLDEEVLEHLQASDELAYNSVEDDVYCAEVEEKKTEIINSLPQNDRRIYLLYEKHKFSIEEIARFTSLSEATIRNKISSINALIARRLRPIYTAISILGVLMGGGIHF